jgi:hypothetical protein
MPLVAYLSVLNLFLKVKATFITVLIVLLSTVAYFGYRWFFDDAKISLWDLVPTSAVLIYQAGDCNACKDSVTSSPYHTVLITSALQQAGSELTQKNYLKLAEGSSMITVHKTSKTQFDVIYYVKKSFAEQSLGALKVALGNSFSIKQTDRNFNGLFIYDVTIDKLRISWTDIEDYRVMSLNSILVEDVVRTYLSPQDNGTRNLSEVITLPTVKNDAGNVYLQINKLPDWLSLFTNGDKLFPYELAESSVLDMKAENGSIILSGFTNVDSLQNSLLSLFKDQSPVEFDLKRLISNNAKIVASYGFTNGKALGERMLAFSEKNEQQNLLSSLQVSVEEIKEFYGWFDKEIVVMQMDSRGSKATTIIIELTNAHELTASLDKISELESGDTSNIEKFSSYLLKRVTKPELIKLLLPIVNHTFNDLYYSIVGNAIVFAEDIESLKNLLDDIDQENTWGKSIDKNRFLESTLLESNVSFYVDASEMADWLRDAMNDEWKNFFRQRPGALRELSMCAFQFSNLNENFYTTIHLGSSQKNDPERGVRNQLEVVANLEAGNATQPYIVKSHVDKKWEVILQDSSNRIQLLSREGKTLWKRELDGLITSSISQVDFYSNGKLQYLVSTKDNLYIIDRLGNMVEGYPKKLEFLNELTGVIDYDHSKNYRFITSDAKGVIRMFDKEGKILDGWNGLNTKSKLLVTPRHYRIASRDYITVLHTDGKFSLYNRRGEINKNFPVDLKGRPKGDFYLNRGSRDEVPHFVFVLTDGYRVKIDLEGKELSREILLKQSVDATFGLVPESDAKSYIITRQDSKSLTILNNDLQELVKNEFIGINNSSVKYYMAGTAKEFFTVTDVEQELCYVYGSDGLLLNKEPIPCNAISLAIEGNQVSSVVSYGSTLRISKIQ